MKKFFLPLFLCFTFYTIIPAQSNNSIDSLLQLSDKLESQDSLANWLKIHKEINGIYRVLGYTDSSLSILNRALEHPWRAAESEIEISELAWTYVNRAYLFEQQLGLFLKAKKDYEKAFQLLHQINEEDFYTPRYVWHPLGNIYTRLGENEQAIHFIQKSLTLYEKLGATADVADAYNDLGLIYINTGNFIEAIRIFEKGIAINSPTHNGLIYSNKAKAHLELKEFNQGINAIEASIALLEDDGKNYLINSFLMGAHNLHGILLSRTGNYKKASTEFERALNYKDNFTATKHRKIASIYIEIAANELMQNNLSQSITSYQKALTLCVPAFNNLNANTNPSSSQLQAETVLIQTLIGKANVAKLLYEEQEDTSWLYLAKECYELYFKLEKQLRAEYRNDVSKLSSTEELHKIAESAIALLFQFQELNIEGNWEEQAFQWMEQTKGILLSESMTRASRSVPGLSSDSSLHQLNLYRKQLRMLKVSLQGETTNDSILKLEEKQQLEVNILLLEQNIHERFPSLYEFKNNSNTIISKADLTVFLDEQEANLISYFLGDSLAFISVIHKGHFHLKKINRKDCHSAFSQLKLHLHALNNLEAVTYEHIANTLYQEIISPIDSIALQDNWIIVPDGELNELPFEALVKQARNQTSFKKIDYLLLHKQISYSPSVKFLLLPNPEVETKNNYLGIAPDFSNTPFPHLRHAKQEVEIGQSIFDGQLLIGSVANKARVLEELPNYRIIHLVSHAQKEQRLKEQAWVVLSSKKDDNYKLYPPELLPLQLSTQLLILNACETGIGPYYAGEGTFSLARAFLFAGAQNVVTNLWQANHAVNSEIFSLFYRSVDEDQSSISFALTKAKRDYLKRQSTDEWGAHPYYWAPLTLAGNNQSLRENDLPLSIAKIFIYSLLVIGASLLFWRLKNKFSFKSQESA